TVVQGKEVVAQISMRSPDIEAPSSSNLHVMQQMDAEHNAESEEGHSNNSPTFPVTRMEGAVQAETGKETLDTNDGEMGVSEAFFTKPHTPLTWSHSSNVEVPEAMKGQGTQD
ncbi:hypothetical protein U1Q18_039799, partial [Sarracenia purpurea var. burkii]